jgi:serine acetyltransferase
LSALETQDVLADGNRVVIKGHLTFVEYRYFDTRSPQETRESISDVKKLATVLHQVNATSTHILCCRATVYEAEYDRSRLLYDLPSEPTKKDKWTLALAIEDKRRLKPSLGVRIRYAVEISKAVMFTHAAGLVHKSIRPENVLSKRNHGVTVGESR